MNTVTLTIVAGGDQYVMDPVARVGSESDADMVARALHKAEFFVKTNQLGDFESISAAWS